MVYKTTGIEILKTIKSHYHNTLLRASYSLLLKVSVAALIQEFDTGIALCFNILILISVNFAIPHNVLKMILKQY